MPVFITTLLYAMRYISLTRSSSDYSHSPLSQSPDFAAFVSERPVLKTIYQHLEDIGLKAIIPLNVVGMHGGADTSEVAEVLSRRHAAVLSRGTMLKSDFFLASKRLGLPENIDGVCLIVYVRLMR